MENIIRPTRKLSSNLSTPYQVCLEHKMILIFAVSNAVVILGFLNAVLSSNNVASTIIDNRTIQGKENLTSWEVFNPNIERAENESAEFCGPFSNESLATGEATCIPIIPIHFNTSSNISSNGLMSVTAPGLIELKPRRKQPTETSFLPRVQDLKIVAPQNASISLVFDEIGRAKDEEPMSRSWPHLWLFNGNNLKITVLNTPFFTAHSTSNVIFIVFIAELVELRAYFTFQFLLVCKDVHSFGNGTFFYNFVETDGKIWQPFQHRRVSFACNPGYSLHGADSLICLESGQWSSGLPYCGPQQQLEQPDSLSLVTPQFTVVIDFFAAVVLAGGLLLTAIAIQGLRKCGSFLRRRKLVHKEEEISTPVCMENPVYELQYPATTTGVVSGTDIENLVCPTASYEDHVYCSA